MTRESLVFPLQQRLLKQGCGILSCPVSNWYLPHSSHGHHTPTHLSHPLAINGGNRSVCHLNSFLLPAALMIASNEIRVPLSTGFPAIASGSTAIISSSCSAMVHQQHSLFKYVSPGCGTFYFDLLGYRTRTTTRGRVQYHTINILTPLLFGICERERSNVLFDSTQAERHSSSHGATGEPHPGYRRAAARQSSHGAAHM